MYMYVQCSTQSIYSKSKQRRWKNGLLHSSQESPWNSHDLNQKSLWHGSARTHTHTLLELGAHAYLIKSHTVRVQGEWDARDRIHICNIKLKSNQIGPCMVLDSAFSNGPASFGPVDACTRSCFRWWMAALPFVRLQHENMIKDWH